MRIKRIFVFSLVLICGVFSTGLAREVMPWVTPTSIGGINTEVYYAHSTQKVKLDITGYQVPFDYISQKVNMKFTFRPSLGLEVYGLAGVAGSELKNGNRSYKGKMDAALYGAGIRYVMLGDIVILPAISLALGLTYSSSNLTEENGTEIDFTLDTTELQGTVTASKKIGMVTPYAGLKLFHNWIRWKDNVGGDKGKGSSGDISPFLGGKILTWSFLSIKGEISFADELTYAGGLSLSLGL
ncbi:hypothetical protein GTN66_01305 [bacterium]|nr:hypothetical protein [bacterium]NIN91794.1 hypothetical protein [bacterium]NIO18082.1 hypothetical protein [bacterium]NIO73047.1 hypothetical protein [bacterium]